MRENNYSIGNLGLYSLREITGDVLKIGTRYPFVVPFAGEFADQI